MNLRLPCKLRDFEKNERLLAFRKEPRCIVLRYGRYVDSLQAHESAVLLYRYMTDAIRLVDVCQHLGETSSVSESIGNPVRPLYHANGGSICHRNLRISMGTLCSLSYFLLLYQHIRCWMQSDTLVIYRRFRKTGEAAVTSSCLFVRPSAWEQLGSQRTNV